MSESIDNSDCNSDKNSNANTSIKPEDELAALPTEIEQIVENTLDQSDTHEQVVLMGRSGPLPSPKELIDYDKAFPGLAMRIVRMAELVNESRINENQSDSALRKSALYEYWQTVRERNRLWTAVALAAILLDGYLAHLNIYAGAIFGGFEIVLIRDKV